MLELIKKLEDLDRDSLNMVLTVVGPELTGEKCLLSDGQLIWESGQRGASDGFFREHLAQAALLTQNGIFPLEGKQLLCEKVVSEKKLIVCGAGHVGQQVIRIGRMLEMEVTVLEDREEFAGKARQAGAQKVLYGSYADCMKQVRGSDDSYFVVLTHGHRCDQDCVKAALLKKHAYVGMIGSRRHGKIIKENLAAEGMDEGLLDELHTPIGLSIGAQTPSEIAVAIMAEIIALKPSCDAETGFTKEVRQALLKRAAGTEDLQDERENGRPSSALAVLATIADRQGSAPRRAGTKMAVFPDGTIAGTIGGGSGEARAIQAALDMIGRRAPGPEMLHEIMMAGPDDRDRMVCGGEMRILLEAVADED
jgi:xanthine dehydrogenase accessory factor